MPEPQGAEIVNELVDFAGAGHDINDPPEEDTNPDPPPRPRHAPGADTNADPPPGPRTTPGADTNAGSRSNPHEDNVGADATNNGDDFFDFDDEDEIRSQVLLSPRRSSDDNIDNDITVDEDTIDLNEILRDCVGEESFDKYQAAQNRYETMKKAMIREGTQVLVGKKEYRTRWNVVDDILESDLPDDVPYFKEIGIKGFDFADKVVIDERGKTSRINFHELLIHLWPGDWKEQLEFINSMIEEKQQLAEGDSRSSVKKVSRVSEQEFWKFFGLMLAGRLEGRMGTLWDTPNKETDGIRRSVNYTSHMTRTRFNEIRHYVAFVFADKTREGKDEWWQVLGGIDGFNENRKKTVQAPNIRVLDESMSAFRPRTTKTGNLPFLSYVLRKPEPLGSEFKTLAVIQIGKCFIVKIK